MQGLENPLFVWPCGADAKGGSKAYPNGESWRYPKSRTDCASHPARLEFLPKL